MSQLLMRLPSLEHLPEQRALPDGYAVREYQPGDEAALARVMVAATGDSRWDAERVMHEIVALPTTHRTYVVTCAGEPVGTATALVPQGEHAGSGYLHWVAVDPAHQGRRLGAAATLAVLQAFRQFGLKDAILETDDHRLAAIRTYQKLGFVPEHRDPSHIARWAQVASDLLAAANL